MPPNQPQADFDKIGTPPKNTVPASRGKKGNISSRVADEISDGKVERKVSGIEKFVRKLGFHGEETIGLGISIEAKKAQYRRKQIANIRRVTSPLNQRNIAVKAKDAFQVIDHHAAKLEKLKPPKVDANIFTHIIKALDPDPLTSQSGSRALWRGFRSLAGWQQLAIGAGVGIAAFGLGKSILDTYRGLAINAEIMSPTPDIQEVYDQIDYMSNPETLGSKTRRAGSDFGSPLRLAGVGIRKALAKLRGKIGTSYGLDVMETLSGSATSRAFQLNLDFRGKSQLHYKKNINHMPLRLPRIEGSHVAMGSWLPGRTTQRVRKMAITLTRKHGTTIEGTRYNILHGRSDGFIKYNSKVAAVVDPSDYPITLRNIDWMAAPEEMRGIVQRNAAQRANMTKRSFRIPRYPNVNEFSQKGKVTLGRSSEAYSRMKILERTDPYGVGRRRVKSRPMNIQQGTNTLLEKDIDALGGFKNKIIIDDAGSLPDFPTRVTQAPMKPYMDPATKGIRMDGAILRSSPVGVHPYEMTYGNAPNMQNVTLELSTPAARTGHHQHGNALVQRRYNNLRVRHQNLDRLGAIA